MSQHAPDGENDPFGIIDRAAQAAIDRHERLLLWYARHLREFS